MNTTFTTQNSSLLGKLSGALLKSLFISLILVLGTANAWAATQTYVAGEYIYIKNFVPSGWGSTTWILSNSYAWAHMWGGTAGEHDYLFELYSGTAGASGAIYRAKVTTGGTYTNVIFTRNSSNKGPWDDKWNQTGNIVLDGSSNCFTSFTADGTTKTCSKYAAAPTAATLTLAGAVSGDGSQANPYNVYEGENYTLTASGTFPDPGNTKQYAFNNTTYSTTNTKTVSFTSGTTSYYANVRAAEGTTYSTAKKVTIYLNVIAAEVLSTITITTNPAEGGRIEVDGLPFTPGHTVQVGATTTKQVTTIPNEGYGVTSWEFKGAAKYITGSNTVTLASDGSGKTGELIANYIPLSRNIKFDKQSGEGGTDAATVTYTQNDYSPTPVVAPKRAGYTFGGYYSEEKGEGVQVVSAEGAWQSNANGYTDADGNWLKSAENTTLYAQWNEITYTINISTDGNGSVEPSGKQQIGIEGLEVTATPNDPSRSRFTKWEVSDGVQVADNYGATTTITATKDGEVIAHFEELQPKTIYLKTVEGTTDGYKWFIKYGGQDYSMDELGCTGEYYRGDVPEQTEFQLIAKDQNGSVIAKETRDGLVVPDDNKNMLNLVSVAAGGDKIFFKPNSHWKNHRTHKYFVARFWAGSAVIKDLIDNDGDGIYECEKPAGATEVYFCLTKAQASTSNWNDWPSDKEAQTHDNVKEGFKDGKNLFTINDDQEVGGDNDTGTWSEFANTPINGEGEWTIFEGATYRITFDHSGATSGTTTPGVAYVDAQHNSSMPVIELESLPKNTDWKFGGYYTAAVGGIAITNAFGDWLDADGYISNSKWVKEECVTLYAHWVEKTPEITNVTLGKDVFDVGSTETTTATPTVVKHSYQGNFTICWKLLDNSGTVMDLFPFTPEENNSVSFSVDGLTSGIYTVRASIYDTDCDTGEELSRYDAKFTIVSGYKVTVKYLCGDNVIKASDIAPGHATTPMDITAPEIGGYKFVNWELGDGIYSESDLSKPTISYTAIYDGYLTAKYEKKKLIFLDLSTLKTKANWKAPHIYLYKGAKNENTGGYWNDQTGAGGAKGGNYITHAAMTEVPNTENIWYFDYEQYTDNFNVFVAFTSNNQGNATHFANCEAIYRTEFSSGTPVFVPESDQTAETKNFTAKYYSKGYWVKYMGGTGYWLIIYNAEGNKELVRREFTSETQRMTMTSIVDLEAEHTYQYEIYRNDGYYYNGGDITYSTKDYTPLDKANKGSIHTTETGDYTFTLDYFDGDLQIKVQHPGEVGNYRILYTDDVRNGRYKPSQIISKNNKEPLVSFFIRPNDNPVLKVQSAARVTGEGVTWATTENEIFFKPNANWKSDGARFAAYFYNNSKNEWVDLKANGDLYSCAKPTTNAYTHVIFCRMDPKNPANNFNKGDGKPLWNQTRNLSLPTDGKNFYALEEGAWRGQIYLKPNSNWTADGARFAAYFFEKSGNNTTAEVWNSMYKTDDNIYWCDVPDGCSKVIFCRMNPNVQDNNWNQGDGNPFWGMQTKDLTIPINANDLYTITNGQNNPNGEWSCRSWSTINGSITDLSVQLKNKLAELDLEDIKETEGSVFNIHLSNNEGTLTIEKVALYTGNYYIRVDAVDGKWYDYKTNSDNLMTYSAFSESEENSFGEKFSHYKTKWCTQGTNVKFVIANDYSLCISDTLVQDAGNPFGNIDAHGNITNDGKYNANIRFMWNRHTNKVSRAYVAAASDEARKFLVLKANKTIQNESGHAINNNEVVFQDTQNWLYERTIKVQPGTLVKLYACYPDLDEAKAQHFRGKYSNDFTKDVTAVQILGGNSSEWYTMRIVYDFKTNRLMGAWVPDQKIDGDLEIDADVMVIRQHQEDATCITFANEGSTLTAVKTVYGVIRFNRWTLNNRSTSDHKVLPVQNQKSIYERALYFISFPFDVHLSDVFGFGTYGTHWVISEYNGLRRAQRGYFAEDCINEDCTNWDYIWDPSNFTLKANQGYLLSLDLDLMKSDNTSFWAHDIQQVELFFPSYANVQTIEQTSYTMPALGEEYLCKINHNTDGTKPDRDRRVKDSYWRCIGVPSFADFNSTLTDGTNTITWQPQNGNIPFLYEWNVSDNSLMVRAASKYKFRPTYAYLVQNGQKIHWSVVNTKPSTPIIARQRTEADRNYEWKIALLRNGNQEDQTFLRITDNENVTTAFDFNQDLAKEFNYGRGDIYTLIGYERVAANSMPCSDKTTIIPLGLNIEQAGDYTIAMPEGVENIGITLVDNETGIHTNLSAGQEYTLTLNNGICENRLFIEVSPIQNTPTDLEYTTEDTREQTTRKVLINEKLYIIRDGVIYDAQGHRL